jgi:hypothetical protein
VLLVIMGGRLSPNSPLPQEPQVLTFGYNKRRRHEINRGPKDLPFHDFAPTLRASRADLSSP